MRAEESLQSLGQRERLFKIALLDEHLQEVVRDIDDGKLVGSQIAALANAHPVEDFRILRWTTVGELSLVNPSDLIELKHESVEYFIVIRSSELFFLLLDGLSFAWPLATISAKNIRTIARLSDDVELVLDLRDEADRVLDDADLVHLDAPGLERLYTRKILIVIKVDGDDVEFDRRFATPAEIIKRVGKEPATNYLVEFHAGHPQESLQNSAEVPIRLCNGLRFGVLSTGPTTVS